MIVDVKNLNKSYGKHKVLNDLSFKIEKPQVLALIGPNGSGKSTLMNCMMNLISFDSGEIEILGKSNKDYEIFREVSFLKDNRVLYPYLTGFDHLKYICDIQKIPQERIEEVIELADIGSFYKKIVSSYSLGMKQRLLLAMALCNNPKLILMDEPLNGLDTDSIFKFRDLIKNLGENNTTILISSHSLNELDYITNDILFLKGGSVIYEDIEIYKQTEYRIFLENSDDMKVLQNFLDTNSENIKYQIKEAENSIIFNLKDSKINQVLSFIYENNIKIKKILAKTYGAEDRYRKIFALD
ncbi:ABC transporter ATP-binding protein [Anaerococcus sp. Marseille-P3625]|uniref:ABC transporter ATP-binding protein n=1 Tax=Anaerococcus sp. Marseille-P3625 TaxID=1977277 RepID=UPI000C06D022|nr:ABC transporter ATP-binding protein [Anaerococcus sp. Marseille-P3625]